MGSAPVSGYLLDTTRVRVKMQVTVSSEFEVVIPEEIRESLGIRPGQKLEAIQYDGRIELVPIRPIAEMIGFLPGIGTRVEREPDRS